MSARHLLHCKAGAAAIAAAVCLFLGGCAMMQENTPRLKDTIQAQADNYLVSIGETEAVTSAPSVVEGTLWYAVPAELPEEEPFRVFVRLTKDGGSECRDDRVLLALSRQMTALWQEQLPPEAAGCAWVSFADKVPAHSWGAAQTLQTVADSELLEVEWYILLPQEQADTLEDTVNALADTMAAQGWHGAIRAAALPAADAAALGAAQPPVQLDWVRAARGGLFCSVPRWQ